MKSWAPAVGYYDSLKEVPGGHVYCSSGKWWAHPAEVKHGYAWGPFQTRESAVAALEELTRR